ncbi:MAG TPA: hypothetical protein HA282_00545 [Nanoarchaeota archaeon]|nr:hypothetical protein [Candidatus Pacearchaeota archaeon]HIH17732.1 hypothetical protein [Nanoarchaeota archaeon]HIH33796.1 hypothetical protein [Nanoarchaeota archaeon]HIH51625.1 hypothetical protein [Nanoarchaeota archaeon]HIH65690.1 hypothetical protein [Nanoarchaeota archaeon]
MEDKGQHKLNLLEPKFKGDAAEVWHLENIALSGDEFFAKIGTCAGGGIGFFIGIFAYGNPTLDSAFKDASVLFPHLIGAVGLTVAGAYAGAFIGGSLGYYTYKKLGKNKLFRDIICYDPKTGECDF